MKCVDCELRDWKYSILKKSKEYQKNGPASGWYEPTALREAGSQIPSSENYLYKTLLYHKCLSLLILKL